MTTDDYTGPALSRVRRQFYALMLAMAFFVFTAVYVGFAEWYDGQAPSRVELNGTPEIQDSGGVDRALSDR